MYATAMGSDYVVDGRDRVILVVSHAGGSFDLWLDPATFLDSCRSISLGFEHLGVKARFAALAFLAGRYSGPTWQSYTDDATLCAVCGFVCG